MQTPLQHAEPNDDSLSNYGFGAALVNCSAPTSATPVKYEGAGEQGNEDCTDRHERYVIYPLDLCFLYSSIVCYSRKEEQRTYDSTLRVARHFTQTSLPPVPPTATIRSPPPTIPVRVAGSKRKSIDEQDARCHMTNPASRTPELLCVIHFSVIHLTY